LLRGGERQTRSTMNMQVSRASATSQRQLCHVVLHTASCRCLVPRGPRGTGALVTTSGNKLFGWVQTTSTATGGARQRRSPVIDCVNRSHRWLATAEDPLHKGGLRGALAALGLRHAGHHLVDVLAAASPRRVTAPAADHLSTHRAFLLEGWSNKETTLYPQGCNGCLFATGPSQPPCRRMGRRLTASATQDDCSWTWSFRSIPLDMWEPAAARRCCLRMLRGGTASWIFDQSQGEPR